MAAMQPQAPAAPANPFADPGLLQLIALVRQNDRRCSPDPNPNPNPNPAPGPNPNPAPDPSPNPAPGPNTDPQPLSPEQVRQNPAMLQTVLQELQSSNPAMLQFITEHQACYLVITP